MKEGMRFFSLPPMRRGARSASGVVSSVAVIGGKK
jgi:hypothetical protein